MMLFFDFSKGNERISDDEITRHSQEVGAGVSFQAGA